LNGTRYTFAHVKALYPQYQLQNLADHRAMVILPYSVNAYGLIEAYALGIPLFVPSLDLLMQPKGEFAGLLYDRKVSDIFYCGPAVEVPPPHPGQPHPFSPESDDPAARRYWYGFAEFYTRPHITIFDCFDDLLRKLDAADFADIHRKMMSENARQKQQLTAAWDAVLSTIETGQYCAAHLQAGFEWLVEHNQLAGGLIYGPAAAHSDNA